jgi:hypothetical protein
MPLIIENNDLPVQLVRFSPGKALNSFLRSNVSVYELQKLMIALRMICVKHFPGKMACIESL